jgi:Na+-transporting methylmalonyl-CoA/oxaloacetate decarboxylase gamma subunit
MTYAILVVLVVILGAMSWVVERAGKPEPPKTPTAEEAAARQQAMAERMKQEQASRAKMLQSIKASQKAHAAGGKQPVNPTAPEPPPPPKGVKNKAPAGALDVTGDWFKERKPGDVGLKELEQESSQEPPAPAPPPKLAPTASPK